MIMLLFLFAFFGSSIVGGGFLLNLWFGIPMWIGGLITIGLYMITVIIIVIWDHFIYKE